ncbi:GNAT family N-acetyltransferase [Bacillus massilinigeriensis]|uniref:GNAT family N-acetyltransferase n=1 Tax=Bacillus massilionigeriensis TaxID=1805475 RepID=UPI00096AE2A8|nr:GNAT family N-acetyltransferase [Bacillus massilionigeriensis]
MRERVELKKISLGERDQLIPYLLLADESEEMVKEYLDEGDLYAVYIEDQIAGVALFIEDSSSIVELKNIALTPNWRGRGIGREIIQSLFNLYRGKYRKMIVGTANSSIDNIAFYQKCGFRITSIRKDFFRQYPEPIFEDGIQALDMIMFEKELS